MALQYDGGCRVSESTDKIVFIADMCGLKLHSMRLYIRLRRLDFHMKSTKVKTASRQSSVLNVLHRQTAPLRASRRLAAQAELAGGRKVYSHTRAPYVPGGD
jgi:hypothetical protein